MHQAQSKGQKKIKQNILEFMVYSDYHLIGYIYDRVAAAAGQTGGAH
jgi:hypothetical protein